ncbi:MAG: RimK/LysX family protein [Candidatus Saccharimonadaceae bacterium]
MVGRNKIVGCLEYVGFPELGINSTLAKVDTGAFSGAIHCTDIKVVKRGKDHIRVLKFTPLGKKSLAQETTDFERTYVRSATGHRQKRFIIITKVSCGGKEYLTKIGLSDRHDMKREVLLGRRFLRENGIKVDVRINSELDDEGENTR